MLICLLWRCAAAVQPLLSCSTFSHLHDGAFSLNYEDANGAS